MKKILLPVAILILFAQCKNETHHSTGTSSTTSLTDTEKQAYAAKGKAIAQASFKALAGKLQAAMKAGGVPAAIDVCSSKAQVLTDSLSKQYGVQIKRTSLKLRNPANRPTEAEQKILEKYAGLLAENKKPAPVVAAINDTSIAFYAPILINKPVCLKCHGTVGETIAEEDYALIRSRYPQDKATGFKQGDLRGIWSITMKR